ncbi:MAG: TVP38/TMEM64 family protein [Bacillota bacterium]|nr:TVP38/TMEM64 family protein [Bacillota bacterium]
MSDVKEIRNVNSIRAIRLLLILIVLIGVSFFLNRHRHLLANFRIREIRAVVQSYGNLSIVAFFVISALKPVILILPTAVLSIASGGVYGPILGSIINIIGCFLSSSTAFLLTRYLGRGFADKLLKGKALKLDNNIEKHGFKIMLFMRLGIIFPFDALSFAAGLSKMKYRDFIFGTVLGSLPEMISYAYAGEHIKNPLSIKFIAPFVIIIILALLFSSMYRKLRKDT